MNNRLICAWCHTVVSEGPEPVSHTICASCDQKQVAELEAISD